MTFFKRRTFPFFCSVGLMCFAPAVVQAQTQQDINRASDEADKIRRQQLQERRELEREKRQSLPKTKIDASPEIRDEEFGPEKCWKIDTIELQGVTLLGAPTQMSITMPYEGKCLRLGNMNAILNDVTTAYFDAGFITSRAYIAPDQNLSSGTLKILVVEGKLEDIRLEDNRGGDTVNLKTVFPGQIGEPFNLRKVEQGLDQINRLASNNATIAIEPGKEPGGSTLVIKNQARDPFTYSLSRNTTGSKSTGKIQYSASGTVDNPMGLTDSFTVSATRTMPVKSKQFSTSVSAGYTVPYGDYTGSVDLSLSEFSTPIALSSGNIARSSGTTFDFIVGLEKMMFRNQDSKVSGFMKFDHKRVRNYFDGNVISVSSHDQAVAQAGGLFDTVVFGGLLDGSYTYSRGLKMLGVRGDPASNAPGTPVNQFTKHEATLGYQRQVAAQPLGVFNASTNLAGQYSDDIQYSSQQISIGGFYSVRGFPNISIAGDRGFYARNELALQFSLPDYLTRYGISAAPYVAYDYGQIFANGAGERGVLSSSSVGLRLASKAFSLEIMQADPIRYPARLGEPQPEMQLLLRMSGEGVSDHFRADENSSILMQDRSLGWLDNGWFAGAERGTMRFRLSNKFSASSRYIVDDSAQMSNYVLGRKQGLSRIYMRYASVSEPDPLHIQRVDANIDVKLMETPIAPFVGLSAGYMSYLESGLGAKNPGVVIVDKNGNAKDKLHLKGFTYGGRLGLVYDGPGVTAYGAVEAVMQEASDIISFNGVSSEFEIAEMNLFLLGLIFKF